MTRLSNRRAHLYGNTWIFQHCRIRLFSTSIGRGAVERRSGEKLPDVPARTRFAPSPTGNLHLGSLRTAIFNYLTAKATGGQCVLRIEDTDQKRLVADSEKRLIDDLKWAGLEWDEGPDIGGPYGPYRQSERTFLYQRHAQELLNTGHAYRCFCSAERLNEMARSKHAAGLPTGYDKRCREIPGGESESRARNGEPHVVRLKITSSFTPRFTDLVHGKFKPPKNSKSASALAGEDSILLKTDGLPTYHLANVVDDHEMQITHVIRAQEWLSSTPMHTVMYNAFGWKPPLYAHVGLLQDSAGQKLSKRFGSNDLRSLRESGIFPEALVNYLTLLGWSHKLTDDFLPRETLLNNFDLRFTKGNSQMNPAKLVYLQKRFANFYARKPGQQFEKMVDQLFDIVSNYEPVESQRRIWHPRELRPIISTLITGESRHWDTPLGFFARHFDIFYDRPRDPERNPLHGDFIGGPTASRMLSLHEDIAEIPSEDWDITEIQKALNTLKREPHARRVGISQDDGPAAQKYLYRYLRWALYSSQPGPDLASIMFYLGRDKTLGRLESAKEDLSEAVQEHHHSHHE